MKKILVTGGAGFIGSHLCETLCSKKGYEVYSLDNYSTGVKKNHVIGVTYIKGDTRHISTLIDFKVDVIYHLGEYSRVEQSFDDLEQVWDSNKDGTFAVLNFSIKNEAKLIYAGSSTKFGDGGLGRDQSPYGWTKASNTELVKNFGNWFGLSYAIVYFYNGYGRREISLGRYATLIALFTQQMRQNGNLTVVNPGTQKRNFTHVSDIVSGLVLVGEKGLGDEFGIGSPTAYTILEVAKMFGGKVKMIPERQGNRLNAEVLTEKTEALGWTPKQSLPNYIKKLKNNNWRFF